MANQTTIALKNSGSSGNTPLVNNLAYGELAINYADGKIFYRTATDSLGSYSIVVPGVNKDVIFNDSGVFGTSSGISFDKATANLYVGNIVHTNTLKLNTIAQQSTGTYTTSNTNSVVVDTINATNNRTVKYTMQISFGTDFHSEEITIIHDGVTPKIVEYGVIYSNSSLGYFDAGLNSGILELIFVPVNAITTLKYMRTTISV